MAVRMIEVYIPILVVIAVLQVLLILLRRVELLFTDHTHFVVVALVAVVEEISRDCCY